MSNFDARKRVSTLRPKAGDALILPDDETRARIKEASEDMVSLSQSVAPIPILHLAPVPGEMNVWRLVEPSERPN